MLFLSCSYCQLFFLLIILIWTNQKCTFWLFYSLPFNSLFSSVQLNGKRILRNLEMNQKKKNERVQFLCGDILFLVRFRLYISLSFGMLFSDKHDIKNSKIFDVEYCDGYYHFFHFTDSHPSNALSPTFTLFLVLSITIFKL